MKEKVQNKINLVRELAENSGSGSNTKAQGNSHSSDSLLQVVRNSKEAYIFFS